MDIEAFKQKFNLPSIHGYLSEINPKEVEWFWQALWGIRQIFPSLDIYVKNQGSRFKYLAIGIKPIGKDARDLILSYEVKFKDTDKDADGKRMFVMRRTTALLRKARDNGEKEIDKESTEKITKEHSFSSVDFNNGRDYEKWLAQTKGYVLKTNYSLESNGLLPTDYPEETDTNKINSLENGHSKEDSNMSNQAVTQALNRILFGTAGTGKTFHSINHALSIIENKSLEALGGEDREELKKRFDHYKDQGKIKFVTFHQSFSYEDFVEGVRAETDDEGNLTYGVQAGIFKEICGDAQIEVTSKNIGTNVPTEFSINSAIDNLIEKAKHTEQSFYTKRNAEIKVTSNQSGTLFALTSKDTTRPLSIKHIRHYLKTGQDNIIDNKAYEWAIAKSLRSAVEYEETNSDSDYRPYVLIIDEINRGNISRIFGELITLIEDSKRQGAQEALSVTLPYSKEEFSVPDNLYLVGTMNSSDRSLTGLDIALRRRFTFIEMPPKPELLNGVSVDGVDIQQLLTVMNQRIEFLLDRDHCLGHANFMLLKEQPTLNNLADIFKQKIIPQLQEYFFDDWEKINLVLNGNGMLESKSIEKSEIFPNVDSEELGYLDDKKTWELVPTSFESIESFAKIIRHG